MTRGDAAWPQHPQGRTTVTGDGHPLSLDPELTPARRFARVAGLVPHGLLWLAVLVAFAPSLANQFVRYDDYGNVVNNPGLHPLTWQGVAGFWQGPYLNLYIPLSYNWFGLEAWLSNQLGGAENLPGQLRPDLFHAGSLLLHAVNVSLVYVLLGRLLTSGGAWWGTLLFAIHPFQAESLGWVTEQRGLLASLGLLAALAIWTSPASREAANDPRSAAPFGGRGFWWRWSAATIAFGAGLLCKPSAVVFPLLAVIWDRHFRRYTPLAQVLLTVPWFLLAAVCTWAAARLQPGDFMSYVPAPWQRPFVAGDALGFYLVKFLWPWPLCSDYGRSPEVLVPSGMVYLTGSLGLLALGAAGLACRSGLPRLGLAWIVAALLPVLGLWPFGFQETSTVADRYAYLPLVAAGLGAGCLWQSRGLPAGRWGLVAFLIVCGGLSFRQMQTWHDTSSLAAHLQRHGPDRPGTWILTALAREYEQGDLAGAEAALRQGVTVRPASGWPAGWLAAFLARHNRRDEARALFRQALWRDPKRIEIRRMAALLAVEDRELDEAIAQLRRIVATAPRSRDDRARLARAMAQRGLWAEAAEEFATISQTTPRDLKNWEELASAREQLGQWDLARQAWQVVSERDPAAVAVQVRIADAELRLDPSPDGRARFERLLAEHPEDLDVRRAWAIALVRAQAWEEAAGELDFVLRQAPSDARALYHRGLVWAAQGRLPEAATAYQQAVGADPALAEAQLALASTLQQLGRAAEAIGAYRRALELAPEQPQLHNNLGVLLAQRGQIAEARAAFQRALALAPDYTEARQNLAAISARGGGS